MISSKEGFDLLLEEYDIPVSKFKNIRTIDEAISCLRNNELRFPIVLKGVVENVIHKTELGLVITKIYNEEQLVRAFNDLKQNAQKSNIALDLIEIEEMVIGGTEVFIGGKRDLSFGNIITIGTGGIFAEVYKDSYSNLMTQDTKTILSYLKQTKVFKILNGYRNTPSKDIKFLVKTISKLIKLFEENEDIEEFDINPFISLGKGGYAVDHCFLKRKDINKKIVNIQQNKKNDLSRDIFTPECIAIVGATDNNDKIGYHVFKHALACKKCKIIPINSHRGFVQNEKAYTSVLSVPEDINIGICVISVPCEQVVEIIKECCNRRIKLVIVISAGFSEAGEKGKLLEKQISEIIENKEIRIIGPNCLGIIIPEHNLNLTYMQNPRKGNIALISQSGSVASIIIDTVNNDPEYKNIGFSFVSSIGNQCDLSFIDYIKYVFNDDDTKVILLYIEGITKGQELIDFCKNNKVKKQVVIIKAGVSEKGKQMSMSHTGSLIANSDIYANIFDSLGFITTSSINDAITIAGFLSQQHTLQKRKTAIITNAGGVGIMINDFLDKNKKVLSVLSDDLKGKLKETFPTINCNNNPIDIIGDATNDRIKSILQILNDDKDVNTIIYVGFNNPILQEDELIKNFIEFKQNCNKCFLACLLAYGNSNNIIDILSKNYIPTYTSLKTFMPILTILAEN